MCIICASKSGVRQPSTRTIEIMFNSNPHGAGYMFARDGLVTIHKGFMDLDEYLDAIKSERFMAEDNVVYHFRISTQAGVDREMTHPFPLSNQGGWLRALDVECPVGIAHNGIIRLTSNPEETKYSDTALFIAKYMRDLIKALDDLRNQAVLDKIESLAKSKFAIMDGSGYIATIGEFLNTDGLLLSNTSYLGGSLL